MDPKLALAHAKDAGKDGELTQAKYRSVMLFAILQVQGSLKELLT